MPSLPPLNDQLRKTLKKNVNSASYRTYIIGYHVSGEMKFPDDYDNNIDPAVKASITAEIEAIMNHPDPDEVAAWETINGRFTVENLRSYIAAWEIKKPFGNHLEEARRELNTLLYKPIMEEWEKIKGMSDATSEEIKNKQNIVSGFISRYRQQAPELSQEAESYLKELKNKAIDTEWIDLKSMPIFSLAELKNSISLVKSFINRYQSTYPNKAAEAQSHLEGLLSRLNDLEIEESREKERSDWDRVDKTSFNAIITYLKTHPNSPFKDDADNALWALASSEPFRKKNLQRYLNTLPYGLHYPEAQEFMDLMVKFANGDPAREEVLVVEDIDIFDIKEWLEDHVDSTLYPIVDSMFEKSKEIEIEKIRQNPAAYSDLKALSLLNQGIFDKGELFYHGFANEWSLQKLRERQTFERNHPVDTPKGTYDEIDGEVTDVFLFGVPNAGKTCVLSGLINSEKSQFVTIKGDGKYVELLQDYCSEASSIPGRTKGGFVAVCQGKIKDSDNEYHQVNLIDMAGEDFAIKIANNQAGTTSFADMGHGASELLASDHRKVVFIIIDPSTEKQKFTRNEPILDAYGNVKTDADGNPLTQDVRYEISQINTLSRLAQLFAIERRNKSVCDNLNAIHFVVTKSDTLGDQTNMESLVREKTKIYETNLFDMIKDLCAPDKLNIPSPRIFPFSLGQFYIGGIYSYSSNDSNLLLDAICCASSKVRRNKFIDGINNFLNSPLF